MKVTHQPIRWTKKKIKLNVNKPEYSNYIKEKRKKKKKKNKEMIFIIMLRR